MKEYTFELAVVLLLALLIGGIAAWRHHVAFGPMPSGYTIVRSDSGGWGIVNNGLGPYVELDSRYQAVSLAWYMHRFDEDSERVASAHWVEVGSKEALR